jgi:hypothetical protein
MNSLREARLFDGVSMSMRLTAILTENSGQVNLQTQGVGLMRFVLGGRAGSLHA